MPRINSTYIYLAVLLGLGCYATFIDKKMPGTKEQEEADSQLFKLNPDDVTGLEITNVHGVFIFQKKDNHWEIKKPVDTLADGPTVEGVINQIAYAQPKQIIKSDKFTDATLKEWGLSPAAERVVIHTQNKQYELLVGRKVAINDSVYARASGRKKEPVRIMPSMVKEVLQKDLSEFRSRSVFNFELDKVVKVTTRTADTTTMPGQQCEIDLKDGKWSLQSPLVARASTPDVQSLLNKILAARAIDFVTDDSSNLSQYGLTSPSATLTVTLKPDEDIVLQIGNPVPTNPEQVYAQRLKSNSVFTLSRSSVDDLLRAVPNVRDRHILTFDPGKPTALTFLYGNKKGQAQKEHGLWSTVGDSQGRADVGKITDILTRLSQLETTPLVKDSASAADLKTYGLDKPQGKITLEIPNGDSKQTLTLLIGKDVNKVLYVHSSAEPSLYTIPDNALDFLPTDNLSLRDVLVINVPFKNVESMTVTTPTVPPIVMVRSAGGTWTATNVKDRMVDSLRADTQASLLCQLQAKSWLGPILPSYGLSKPLLSITLQASNLKNPITLHIGAALPGGSHFASLEGETTAFEIAEGDFNTLNTSSIQTVPKVLSETNAAPVAPATNVPPASPEKK